MLKNNIMIEQINLIHGALGAYDELFVFALILLLLGWLAYKSSKATKEKDRKKRTKRKNK
tara:strand:+ start:2066 stop:2245 length:180 start_codon:yes stop_codon:yes gene_type:complete